MQRDLLLREYSFDTVRWHSPAIQKKTNISQTFCAPFCKSWSVRPPKTQKFIGTDENRLWFFVTFSVFLETLYFDFLVSGEMQYALGCAYLLQTAQFHLKLEAFLLARVGCICSIKESCQSIRSWKGMANWHSCTINVDVVLVSAESTSFSIDEMH